MKNLMRNTGTTNRTSRFNTRISEARIHIWMERSFFSDALDRLDSKQDNFLSRCTTRPLWNRRKDFPLRCLDREDYHVFETCMALCFPVPSHKYGNTDREALFKRIYVERNYYQWARQKTVSRHFPNHNRFQRRSAQMVTSSEFPASDSNKEPPCIAVTHGQ